MRYIVTVESNIKGFPNREFSIRQIKDLKDLKNTCENISMTHNGANVTARKKNGIKIGTFQMNPIPKYNPMTIIYSTKREVIKLISDHLIDEYRNIKIIRTTRGELIVGYNHINYHLNILINNALNNIEEFREEIKLNP